MSIKQIHNESNEENILNQLSIELGTENLRKILHNELQLNIDSNDLNILDKFLHIFYTTKNYIIFFKSYNFLKMNTKIKIDKSTIHGNGVFAIDTIYKNKIITCYPCHSLKKDNLTILNTFIYGENEKNIDHNIFNSGEYDCTTKLNYHIFGDKTIYNNLSQVGHIINDSCSVEIIQEIQKLNDTYKNMLKYCIDCYDKKNAKFIAYNNFVIVIALKDIKKGEEILINYGYSYWKNKNLYDESAHKSEEKIRNDILNLNNKQKKVLINFGEISPSYLLK